jgi:GTPase
LIPVKNKEDMVLCSRRITDESICPIFEVSSVTGQGLELFLAFLNLLPVNVSSNMWLKNQDEGAEFHITETFSKNGEIIVYGMVYKGCIAIHQKLMLGPNNFGRFTKADIKGIHCKRVPVRQIKAG